MIAAAVLDALLENGASAEMIVAAVKADAREQEKRLEEKRAKDAARQRKSRSSRNVTVTPRDGTDIPPYEDTSTPPKDTTGAKAPSVSRRRASKREIFVCPEGVDAQHWADLMENRERKKCAWTVTAYQDLVADLNSIADDEWPPGRLVRHAAAKGWASINDPRKSLNGHGNARGGFDRQSGGPGITARAALAAFPDA